MKSRGKKNLKKRSKAHIKRGVKVTKAKRIVDEQSEKDTVLRRLHETVPAGIVFVDRNGQITFANARAMQVLGLKRSEIAKRTHNDPAWRITAHDGRPLSDKDLPFQRAKATGKPVFDVRHAILRPDGQRVLLSINAAPISDRSGKFGGVAAVVTDITRYVGAVEMLRESEGRYRQLLETSMDAVSVTVGTKFVYVNKRCAELLDFSDPSQLIGRDFTEFVAPEDREMVKTRTLKRERGEPEPPLYEFKIQRRDGTKILVEAHATVIEYEGKRAVLSFRRDITERKKMEVAVRKSEERFRSIFDNAHVGIALDDMNGHVLDANDAECRFLGYSKEEIVGMHFKEFTYPEDLDEDTELFEELMKGKRSNYTIDKRFIRKTGEIVSGRLQVSLIREVEGSPRHAIVICEDITERKQMEHALLESEENFRALAENAFDGIMITIGEEAHVYANKQAAEITGYSVAELLKTTINDLVHPDDYEMAAERYRRRVAGELPPRSYEIVIVRKDGKSTPIELAAAKTIWQGQPADLVFFRAITERKRMQKELEESEERYRGLFANSRDAITINTFDGKFIDFNQAYLDLLGYSRDELFELKAVDVYANPADRDRFRREIERDGFVEDFEAKFRRKDGTLRDCLVASTAWRDKEGHTLGYQEFVRDITERKHAEDELRRSEERFRKIFQSSPIPALITSIEGPILDVNDAWVRMSGYSREEAIGHSTIELGMAQDPGQRDQMVKDLLEKGRLINVELTRRTKSGELRDVIDTIELVELDGQKCILNMQVDITERKRMEEVLKQSEAKLKALHRHTRELAIAKTIEEVTKHT